MRISRREFVTSVTASGIALSVSRLAIAEEPSFAARETLPGRQAWNPAALVNVNVAPAQGCAGDRPNVGPCRITGEPDLTAVEMKWRSAAS
jgi:hypothetical protein